MEWIIRDKPVARSVEQGGKNPLFVLPGLHPAMKQIESAAGAAQKGLQLDAGGPG
jgi:hypothetical protein